MSDTLEHKNTISSPEEASKIIKSGDRVVLANLCAQPHLLPDLLMERATELRGVKLFHLRPFGRFIEKYLELGMEGHVRCATAFAAGIKPVIQVLKEGRADFYPIALSKVPWLFKSGAFRPDVFITTVSPPDSRGYCSLGVSVDYAPAALQTAETVIAEVNQNMPRTGGETQVHVSQIDYLAEVTEPIYELPPPNITKLAKTIAENVIGLVEDEATIQIGYGAVSESITSFLGEKKNLGMHSEMLSESAMTLVEQGALTCEKKSIDRGKIVCSFAAGTKRLYEWLDGNPKVEMRPFDYTNDSRVIAMNRKMTSINTAMQVDLYGNIYSDILGFDEYSGAGGQPDFVTGATLCPDGRSIIVLPSTTAEGNVSRIVFHPSAGINPKAPLMPTVTRFDADYVVTECGIASLRDKTTCERAKALIEIAHPDFKHELWEEARKRKLIT